MYKLLLKQLIIIVLIILAVLSMVFGAVLPWGKSQAYISALIDMQSGRSFTTDQFKEEIGTVLNFYSPIGQEEVVKFFSSDILSAISQQGYPEPAARFLADYMSGYLFNNNVRHLLIGAAFYQTLWLMSRSESDYGKAEGYLKKAYEIGPNLPPVLYSLFDLYKTNGDFQKMKEIGNEILKYWPEDENVKSLVNLNISIE